MDKSKVNAANGNENMRNFKTSLEVVNNKADFSEEISARKTMTSLEIAELTGKRHTHVMRDIRNMEAAWMKVSGTRFGLASYQDNQGKDRPCYELTKTECLYIATKFNDEARARLVLRWEKLETGQEAPYYQQVQTKAPEYYQPTLKDQINWAKEVKKILNLNDSSTLSMLQQIAKPFNLPLPDYTPSKGILKSASELLKENNVRESAQKFNQIMIAKKMLERVSRPSKGGKPKFFNSLTKAGTEYGENQVSPHNPKETQPLYYAEKFIDLLVKIGMLPF